VAAAFGVAALCMPGPGPQCAEEPVERPALLDEMGFFRAVVRGVPQPPFVTSRCVDELQRDFELRRDDIVVATWPKCGTTWMQQILLSLLYGGDVSKVTAPMEQAPWIEATVCRKTGRANSLGKTMSLRELMSWEGRALEGLELEAPPRRVFKTHATVEMAPWRGGVSGCGGAKVVVVTRNPKDACISMFHHCRDSNILSYWGDFEHFVRRLFFRGEASSGCFWAWHAGWEKAAAENPGTVVWVSYEELKRDFPGTVRRLADFLEIPASDDAIAKTAGASSVSSMKATYAKRVEELEAMGGLCKKNHFRKGEMGSWRNDIDGCLLMEFDAMHKAKTAQHGLKYSFDFGDP